MVYIVIAVFLFIALLDIRELLREKSAKVRAFLVYGVLFASGFIISYLLVIGRAPVSPAVIIQKMVDFILRR